MSAFVNGSGVFLPERVVTNEELAGPLGLDPEWIYKASGIRSRRWAPTGTTTSSLAARALQTALADAALDAGEVDYLLFGTMTPDRFIPGSAYAVQSALRLKEIPCLDIRATCCNALYGLQLAKALVASGAARHVALCLAEVQSPWLRLTPEASTVSMLFGDGASALLVSGERSQGGLEVVDILLSANGSFVDDLGVRRPGTEFGLSAGGVEEDYFPRMNGQAVILQASRRITAACRTIIERNGVGIEQVRWMVPHQANANLLSQVARRLGFDAEGGVVSVLEQFGNTSSASMGIALDTLRRSSSVSEGDWLLLPAFGAGFTWGAGLCRAVRES
ncbi:MAG: 3-oxoacyl-[acyl-carrier-protein] synthase [Acidobacteriota bacterium]|nr:3-oxoacyl-[acyl-carrier-protein] synthase [Acidobacteriota bacterium]